MEKLTLRQFSDVVKALVEANLSKEEGVFSISLTEKASKIYDEGIEIILTGRKTVNKDYQSEDSTHEIHCCESESNSVSYNMNVEYREYELQIMENVAPQSTILNSIAEVIAYGIKKGEEPKFEEPMEDEFDEDAINEYESNRLCKCILKTMFVCMAIPVGLLAVKKLIERK